MTGRTRYFVVASLLTTTVGVGAGLVAYYGGFQEGAQVTRGPAELRYVPPDATLVAFADVRTVMASELRQNLRRFLPAHENGQEQFEQETGISIEHDIDHVVVYLAAPPEGADERLPASALVLARGRFDAARVEGSMRLHGATAETYRGTSVLVAGGDAQADGTPAGHVLGLAFIEPELVAVGSPHLVRSALELRDGGDNVTSNAEILDLVQSVDGDVWAVGLFDALTAQAHLPAAVAERLPPITRFAASGRVNGGIEGTLRADAIDETSATQWRDMVRGVMALVRLQAPSSPELMDVVDSVQIGGTGTTIAISFTAPASLFDWLGQTAGAAGGR